MLPARSARNSHLTEGVELSAIELVVKVGSEKVTVRRKLHPVGGRDRVVRIICCPGVDVPGLSHNVLDRIIISAWFAMSKPS